MSNEQPEDLKHLTELGASLASLGLSLAKIADAAPQPIPWEQFRGMMLEAFSAPAVSGPHASTIKKTLRDMSALGPETTADLTVAFIARFLAARPAGLAPYTIRGQLSHVRTICSMAEASRYLAVSPFRLRKMSRWVRVPATVGCRHYGRSEIRAVLDLMRADIDRKKAWPQWRARRLYALTAIVAYCGTRAGEAQRLWVEDVELEHRVINLVHRKKLLKTDAAAQPVPMPMALVPIVAGWLEHRLDGPAGCEIDPQCPWLIPGTRRKGPWQGGIARCRPVNRLRAVAARAGVEGMTFLALRKSWATHAEAWGLGGAAIQRVLRHTDSRITEKWYRRADVVNLAELVKDADF
jgi:integrase